MHGMICIQGYSSETEKMFSVPANGDNKFLSYGIAENSLLLVDQNQPFEAGRLNIFRTSKIINGQKQLKISLELLEDAQYVGRVVLTINHYD